MRRDMFVRVVELEPITNRFCCWSSKRIIKLVCMEWICKKRRKDIRVLLHVPLFRNAFLIYELISGKRKSVSTENLGQYVTATATFFVQPVAFYGDNIFHWRNNNFIREFEDKCLHLCLFVHIYTCSSVLSRKELFGIYKILLIPMNTHRLWGIVEIFRKLY